MEEVQGRVVGYEANGGFLLGFDAQGPAGPLKALMTRDCTLPIVMTLYAGRRGIAARTAQEPPVVTVADRLQNVAQDKSRPLLDQWQNDPAARADFLAGLGKKEQRLDLTDGLRMVLTDGDVIHIRPSGNAPELRLYIETNNRQDAQKLLATALQKLENSI